MNCFWKDVEGQVMTRYFALDEYPIYIKAGAVLPMYNDKVMNLNGKDETIVLNVIPGKTSSEFTLYEDNGDNKIIIRGICSRLLFTLKRRAQNRR